MRRLLFIFLLLPAVFCRGAAHVPAYDDGPRAPRAFSSGALDAYRAQDEYQYERAPEQQYDFLKSFADWLKSLMPEMTPDGFEFLFNTVQVIFWTVCALLVVFLLLKIMGFDLRWVFTGKAARLQIHAQVEAENLHEMDFDPLIAEALAQGDFRRAVRLYYLKALRLLSEGACIDWKPDKTNIDYYYELKEPALRQQFAQITRVYDYAWYGEFDLNRAQAEAAGRLFQDFYRATPQSA